MLHETGSIGTTAMGGIFTDHAFKESIPPGKHGNKPMAGHGIRFWACRLTWIDLMFSLFCSSGVFSGHSSATTVSGPHNGLRGNCWKNEQNSCVYRRKLRVTRFRSRRRILVGYRARRTTGLFQAFLEPSRTGGAIKAPFIHHTPPA